MARDRIPPTRIPPGGILLGGDGSGPMLLPRTAHQTNFNNCDADVICITAQDEKGDRVIGYAFRIKDPLENHVYVYTFDQDSLMVFQARMGEFPNVGDYVGEENDASTD